MLHRSAFVVLVVVGGMAGFLTTGRAADPAEGRPPQTEPRLDATAPLAGAWSRAADLDRMLGFGGADAGGDRAAASATLDFTLDEKPGARRDDEAGEEIRAEVERLGYKLAATGQLRAGDRPAHDLFVTHQEGATHGCVVVPNVGLVAHRLSLVRGATADRDLLFVEWGTPEGDAGQRLVSAYRRGRAEQKVPAVKG